MTSSWGSASADVLEARLRALGTPERAMAQKAYLRSDLEFFGCTVWQTRAVVSDFLAAGPPPSAEALTGLVQLLWARPIHDRRQAAVLLLERTAGLLGAGHLAFLEGLLRESFTWAYVDPLAGDVAGRITLADPRGSEPVLDRWAVDADFWVRRSSLLALLIPLKKAPDPQPFFAQFDRYAGPMIAEKEFFIRKAIGWVLREVSKRRPALVVSWVSPRTDRASGVTMREAVKYLPEADRDRLMAAYRARRPA